MGKITIIPDPHWILWANDRPCRNFRINATLLSWVDGTESHMNYEYVKKKQDARAFRSCLALITFAIVTQFLTLRKRYKSVRFEIRRKHHSRLTLVAWWYFNLFLVMKKLRKFYATTRIIKSGEREAVRRTRRKCHNIGAVVC